jgi:hypothetical protein
MKMSSNLKMNQIETERRREEKKKWERRERKKRENATPIFAPVALVVQRCKWRSPIYGIKENVF